MNETNGILLRHPFIWCIIERESNKTERKVIIWDIELLGMRIKI